MANEWKCPKCGGVNPAKRDICMGCRTPRPGSGASADGPAIKAVPYAPPAAMPGTSAQPAQQPVGFVAPPLSGDWRCPNCGTNNPAKRDTCRSCNLPRTIDEVAFYVLRKDRASLLRLLEGTDKAKRLAAAKEVTKVSNDPSVHAALLKGADDPDAEVRQACARAYIFCQQSNRQGFDNLRLALDSLSPAGRADFESVLQANFGPDALDWFSALAEEFDARKAGLPTRVELPTPNWGSGGKVATALAVTLLTGGNANAGVAMAGQQKFLLNEHIQVPPVCHVCGLRPPTHELLIEKAITTSLVGMAIAGSSMGDLHIQFKIPLCRACSGLKRTNVASIVSYDKSSGQGRLVLSLYNARVAEKYAELNGGRLLPQVAVTPQVAPGETVDLSDGAAQASMLRLRYEGGKFATDALINVFLDGRPAGLGTAKKGLNLTVKVAAARHKVLVVTGGIRRKEYVLDLSTPGQYDALLSYSRAWGNFSDNVVLRKMQ